ncbi:3-carboxy-cis,cis-muconate cycloisomerase [Streptomyces sp. NBC_00289]|uniref:3-carboxy-cis,cis-muconate cycloisomerase n=1 Tax=Streptomyces sp. NBC_00289 TaxID=2975703 RepID=UPI00324FA744
MNAQTQAPDACSCPHGQQVTNLHDTGLLTPVRVGAPIEDVVSDRAWLQAMLETEAALARAQARLGTVPAFAAEAISATVRAHTFDLRGLARRARAAANPVVPLVEELAAAVRDRDPDAARFVHLGSTSQDILDTAAMLVAVRGITLIVQHLDQAAEALAALASRHREDAMAGRTLTQHATPTTFGLKAAGWLMGLLDARDRLEELLGTRLPVQLGGAAGTMAAYLQAHDVPPPQASTYTTELTRAFATELGLAEPVLPWHTRRSPMADLAHGLNVTVGALGKIALDVLSLARTEVAEIAEPAGHGNGASSAMPQKQNPALATLIRTAALQVPPLTLTLVQSMASEDERPAGAWHAEWMPLRESLRLVGGAASTAADLCSGMMVDAARMRANLASTGALIVSERLSAVLGRRLPGRSAKSVVAQACRDAQASGRPLPAVLLEIPGISDVLSAGEIDDLLDPAQYLGAAKHFVDRALEHYSSRAHVARE